MQLVAPFGREDILIAVAAQLERAKPWAERTPASVRAPRLSLGIIHGDGRYRRRDHRDGDAVHPNGELDLEAARRLAAQLIDAAPTASSSQERRARRRRSRMRSARGSSRLFARRSATGRR